MCAFAFLLRLRFRFLLRSIGAGSSLDEVEPDSPDVDVDSSCVDDSTLAGSSTDIACDESAATSSCSTLSLN